MLVMPFRRRNLFSVLLIGFLVSSVLALRYFLVSKDRSPMLTTRVMEMLDSIASKENVDPSSLSHAENLFKLYDEVETFVLFIGYPRSSHSLVGAVLDAHPEIIIPHEYNVVGRWSNFQSPIAEQKYLQKYLLFYELQALSMKQAMFGIRANNNNTLLTKEFVYTYNVPGLWQGGYQNRIKVIGDKKGGTTSKILRNSDSMKTLEDIAQVVQVPMKIIHVTRNPFDNIATIMLRETGTRDVVREEDEKVNHTRRLEMSLNGYFQLAAANQRVRERYGDAVIDIPGHETVLRPRETIQKLCDHLGVTCSKEYLDKCSKIMYGTPSVTRDKVVWTEEQKKRVTEKMKNYPFLKDYSFDSYPK